MKPQQLPILTVGVKKYLVFCQELLTKLRIQQTIRQTLRFLREIGAVNIAQTGQIPQCLCFIRKS